VPEKKSNRLASLVRGASNDLAPENPIRRGRGLEGMIREDTDAPADMSTSTQDSKTARQLNSSPITKAEETPRTVKSYRIREDLAYRIDVLAATERRKIYEVVEEALDLYLRVRDEEQANRERTE
jgi:hypothetical protein